MSNIFEQPLVVDRKDGEIRVRLHWGRFRVECDLNEWKVSQTLCDSGSTITIFLTPLESRRQIVPAKESNHKKHC